MFEKLDRIVVSVEDYVKMLDWNHKNKDMYDSDTLDFPMTEGLLKLSQYVEKMHDIEVNQVLTEIYHFNIIDSDTTNELKMRIESYNETTNENEMSFDVEFVDNDFKFSNIKHEFKHISQDRVIKSCEMIVSLHLTVLFYMTNAPQIVKETRETKYITKKQKSKKSSKNNSTRRVKIQTVKYTFDYSEGSEKRNYERSAELWTVRGHYRYYKKTGKRVWVKPYVKGEGENLEGKEYTL